MINFIITSEQRVGSRWLHYLLAAVLARKTCPELDRDTLYNGGVENVRLHFKHNIIPKFHRALPQELLNSIIPIDYKIIALVRNPRDRGISLAFHNRYHPKHYFIQKDFNTDLEATQYTILKSNTYNNSNERQFKLMLKGFSTHNPSNITYDFPYIWTTYEWLHKDTQREVNLLLKFLRENPKRSVSKSIEEHSFIKRAKRVTGDERRDNIWFRKGIIGDWKNWFDNEMIEKTREADERYWKIVKEEENKNA